MKNPTECSTVATPVGFGSISPIFYAIGTTRQQDYSLVRDCPQDYPRWCETPTMRINTMPREADPIARARARKQSQALMLAISAGAVVVVIVGVALGVYLTSGGGLSGPAKGGLRAIVGGEDASKWNHAELLEYINSRSGGKKLEQKPSDGRSMEARFYRELDDGEFEWVWVTKCSSPQEAKDIAGLDPKVSIHWGVWLFKSGFPNVQADLRKALN